jgi:hypothetical protein
MASGARVQLVTDDDAVILLHYTGNIAGRSVLLIALPMRS